MFFPQLLQILYGHKGFMISPSQGDFDIMSICILSGLGFL